MTRSVYYKRVSRAHIRKKKRKLLLSNVCEPMSYTVTRVTKLAKQFENGGNVTSRARIHPQNPGETVVPLDFQPRTRPGNNSDDADRNS